MVGSVRVQVFDALPWTYLALKVVRVGNLVYLVFKIATTAPPTSIAVRTGAESKPITFLQTALFQWVNPKA